MPSLYDAVKAENSTYVPQFVGSAYQQLEDTANVLDQRWRENKDYADKIAMIAAQDQVLQGDMKIKDEITKNLYGAIEKIAGSDANFENSTAAVGQLARDVFTNQNRLAALKNYQLAEKERELELQGHNLNFGDSRETFTTVDPETNQPRQFNLNRQKQYDYDKKMKELVGRINPDAGVIEPNGTKLTFDEEERNLIRSGQWQAISPNKVKRLVEALLPSYKESQEGLQDIQKLTKIDGLKGETITVKDGKTIRETTDVDENIRNRFLASIMPQSFYGETQRWDDYGKTAATKAKEDFASYWTGGASGSVQQNTSLNPALTASDIIDPATTFENEDGTYTMYLDKNGNPVHKRNLPNKTLYSPSGISGTNPEYDRQMAQLKRVDIDPVQVEGELNQIYTNHVEQGATNLDYQTWKKDYKEAAIRHKQVTAGGLGVMQGMQESYDNYINRAAGRVTMKTPDGQSLNLATIAEQAEVNKGDVTLSTDQIFYDSPQNDMPGGYVEARVHVKGAKNNNYPTTVLVPLNDQFAAISADIDYLYKNSYYQMKDTHGSINNPYFPKQFKEVNGVRQGFITTTKMKPRETWVDGEPVVETWVTPVYRKRVGGGFETTEATDGNGEHISMPIEVWKEYVAGALKHKFKGALLSGQVFTEKDIKDRGLDEGDAPRVLGQN